MECALDSPSPRPSRCPGVTLRTLRSRVDDVQGAGTLRQMQIPLLEREAGDEEAWPSEVQVSMAWKGGKK